MCIKQLALFLLYVLITFAGCKKKDDDNTLGPAPVADFTYQLLSPDMRAPVRINFTNTSTNAISYNWLIKLPGANPEYYNDVNLLHDFLAGGTYEITLEAKGQSQQSVKTQTITIDAAPSKFKITSIALDIIPPNSASGFPWDVTDGPDVYVEIYSQSTLLFSSIATPLNNLNLSTLPVTIPVAPPLNITSLGSTFTIKIFDSDNPGFDQLIGNTQLYPNSYASLLSPNHYPTEISLIQNQLQFRVLGEWE